MILEEGSDGESTMDGTDDADVTVSTSSTTAPTTSATTVTTTSTTIATTTTTTDPMTTTVDPTGDEPGYCGQVCETLEDCLYPGADPADFACTAGFCEYIATFTCDETTCPPDFAACAFVDGLEQCVISCPMGDECDAFDFQCTGVSDEGIPYCESDPCAGAAVGEPCFIEGFGQIGICDGQACVCTDDSQCTAEGFACNA